MKKALFILGLALFLGLALKDTSAQQWVPYLLPDGSPVLRLKSHGNHVAALGMRGLWFSGNNGDTWAKIPTPFTDDGYSGVDFDQFGNIFITANHFNNWQVMKTSDYGATWQTIDNMNQGYVMDICLANNGWIIAVGGYGTSTTGYDAFVRGSTDQGMTWRAARLNGSCLLQACPNPLSNLPYSRGDEGLWDLDSNDFFPAADLVSSSCAFSRNGEITVIGRKATAPHDKRIFTSVNGGLNWSNTDIGYGDEGRFNDVAYTDDGTALVVGDDIGPQGRYGTVLMKKNNTWESIFPPTTMTFFNAITTNDTYIFIGTQDGKILRASKNITSVQNFSSVVSDFVLNQNYPNPFNPVTKISFSIPRASFVSLKIYDMAGKMIATLLSENKLAGNYTADFNAANLSSGTYFYTLQADGFLETKKMLLVK